jgi:5'-nucleotidase
LITNDDSIYSKGIKTLWKSVKSFADVSIVSPEKDSSGSGMSLTLRGPLHIKKFNWDEETLIRSVSGTTVDCVKMALGLLCEKKVDMIISGINNGTNAGRSVLYSGTIAGIIEGAFRNIPGIAFSSYNKCFSDLPIFEKYVPQIVKFFLKNKISSGTFINVTFPKNCLSEIKGFKMARQGKEYSIEKPSHIENTSSSFLLGGQRVLFSEDKESDIYLLNEGYVTCVPIHVNELTDHDMLTLHKDDFEKTIKI